MYSHLYSNSIFRKLKDTGYDIISMATKMCACLSLAYSNVTLFDGQYSHHHSHEKNERELHVHTPTCRERESTHIVYTQCLCNLEYIGLWIRMSL